MVGGALEPIAVLVHMVIRGFSVNKVRLYSINLGVITPNKTPLTTILTYLIEFLVYVFLWTIFF